MNNTTIIASLAFSLGLAAFAARAHAAPAWCAGGDFKGHEPDLGYLSSPEPEKVIPAIAIALCAPNDEARANAAHIETARQAWGAKLGMTDADWADAAAYATTGRKTYEVSLATKNFAESSPIDQYAQIRKGEGAQPYADTLYLTDMYDSTFTEVGRFAIISWCLDDQNIYEGKAYSGNVVKWAICQQDIDVFDRKKFDAQLRTDTSHDGGERMLMRLRVMDLPKRLKAHAELVQKAWKADASFKTVFDIAAKAQAEWTALAAANTRALALSLQLDSATSMQSRKAFAGCEEATTAVLISAVQAVPPSTFAGMRDVREDAAKGFGTLASIALRKFPAVGIAAVPYMLCQPTSGANSFLANVLSGGAGMRGPHSMTAQRIEDAKIVLDDMKNQLLYPSYRHPYLSMNYEVQTMGGPVKSVKPLEGVKLEVQLEASFVVTRDCVKEHFSNRIERVRDNGQIVYALVCDKEADVRHSNQWQPFTIAKVDAKWAKPGAVISVSASSGAGAGINSVIALWPNKTAKTPSMLLGAMLK